MIIHHISAQQSASARASLKTAASPKRSENRNATAGPIIHAVDVVARRKALDRPRVILPRSATTAPRLNMVDTALLLRPNPSTPKLKMIQKDGEIDKAVAARR